MFARDVLSPGVAGMSLAGLAEVPRIRRRPAAGSPGHRASATARENPFDVHGAAGRSGAGQLLRATRVSAYQVGVTGDGCVRRRVLRGHSGRATRGERALRWDQKLVCRVTFALDGKAVAGVGCGCVDASSLCPARCGRAPWDERSSALGAAICRGCGLSIKVLDRLRAKVSVNFGCFAID